ncbi:hypothetical protein T09_6180 [Trichinella sp. T9]|nr:hypothetical protein T09_6180 [Trichinella sp. T9]
MNFRYKCYYDHEHSLELGVCFRYPILLLKSQYHARFFPISRQIRFHETCD